MGRSIEKALIGIIDQFDGREQLPFCRHKIFFYPRVPAARWSESTRKLLLRGNTYDARTPQQWERVNRRIKTGAEAIMIPVHEVSHQRKNQTPKSKRIPVFRVEDTYGARLDYKQLQMPRVPFLPKANEWGISIRPLPWGLTVLGRYVHNERKIFLATPDIKVFFHELAHAAQYRIWKNPDRTAIAGQEVMAEFAACGLYRLSISGSDQWLGNSLLVIGFYASYYGITPADACRKFLKKTEAILEHILAA